MRIESIGTGLAEVRALPKRKPAVEDVALQRVSGIHHLTEQRRAYPDPREWDSTPPTGADASVYDTRARPIRFAPPPGAYLDETA